MKNKYIHVCFIFSFKKKFRPFGGSCHCLESLRHSELSSWLASDCSRSCKTSDLRSQNKTGFLEFVSGMVRIPEAGRASYEVLPVTRSSCQRSRDGRGVLRRWVGCRQLMLSERWVGELHSPSAKTLLPVVLSLSRVGATGNGRGLH